MILSKLRNIRTIQPFIYREAFPTFAFSYGRLPPWEMEEEGTTSAPFAIDFAFTASPDAVIELPGQRPERYDVPPFSGGAVGAEHILWRRTRTISEFIELRPGPDLIAALADRYRRPADEPYAQTHGHRDPFLIALASRFRAHALGGDVVSDLEGEALTTLAIESTIERDGGRARRRTGAKLDARRLARVQAFLESRISARLTLTALADVAAVSRHHFCVMFRRTTGQTPHAYLTALRMQRASELLARGATVEASAAAVGYKAAHQFRKAFQATFGMSARAFRSKSGY